MRLRFYLEPRDKEKAMKTVTTALLILGSLIFFVQGSEGSVLLNEILADPPDGILGDANRDGIRSASGDEFVELVNRDLLSVSLEGWTLSDATAIRHTFSSSALILPDGFFVVFGGGHPFGFDDFATASTGSLSLNNTGDTVYLWDADKTLIDFFTYGSEGGQDVSLTRFPDGEGPFFKHTSINSFRFSPGTTVDGEDRLSSGDLDATQGAVPEPAAPLLVGLGLLSLVRIKWRPVFAIFLICMSCSNVVFGEEVWEEVTNGIPETDFQTIAVSPRDATHVYVGTSKSLYRTLDGGKSWKNVLSIHGTLKAVHQILITPGEDIWAATDNGLYYSSTQGESWEKRFSGVGDKGRRVFSLAARQAGAGGSIFIGTEEGIFRSEDQGRHWEQGGGELATSEVDFIGIAPQKGEVYGATPMGVYRSEDLGKTWERIFVTSVEVGDASKTDNGIEPEDSDETFTSTEKTTTITFKGDKILLGTKNGAYQSEDGGKNWSKLSQIGLGNSEINSLLLDRGLLYAATGKGLFVFSEEGKSWREASAGLTEGRVTYLSGSPEISSVWATTSKGIFRREEGVVKVDEWKRGVKEVLDHFKEEPSIEEVQEAAVRYAEVHPEKIIAWRKAAERKACFPTLSTGIGVNIDKNIAVDTGGTTNPDFFIVGPDERGFDWDVKASWDLGELIWNDDQTSIDVRSRLMVQLRDDVLDEATRLYFERRRLQIALLLEPPKTLRDEIEKELRLQELTANIDALTGGYLSRTLGGAREDVRRL